MMVGRRWFGALVAGWIGVVGGAPPSGADGSWPALVCRGNEPFWNLEIDGQRAHYTRLGETPRELSGAPDALDYLHPPEMVWRGRGADMAADVVVFVAERTCRDTMSDGEGRSVFSHQVRVSMPDGAVLVGCCALAAVPSREDETASGADVTLAALSKHPVDDWTRFLADMLPAIRTCLDATPGPAPRVTDAWPMNHGMIGMRSRNGDGGWFQCIAPMVGGGVDRFEPVAEGSTRVPGEGEVLFTAPAEGPLAGGCYQHERVVDEQGEVIGWLAHDVC
jgi:uncharacterized membrane protein